MGAGGCNAHSVPANQDGARHASPSADAGRPPCCCPRFLAGTVTRSGFLIGSGGCSTSEGTLPSSPGGTPQTDLLTTQAPLLTRSGGYGDWQRRALAEQALRTTVCSRRKERGRGRALAGFSPSDPQAEAGALSTVSREASETLGTSTAAREHRGQSEIPSWGMAALLMAVLLASCPPDVFRRK